MFCVINRILEFYAVVPQNNGRNNVWTRIKRINESPEFC